MSTKFTHETYYVCTDCFNAVAFADEEVGYDQTEQRERMVVTRHPSLRGRSRFIVDGDDGEYAAFSTSRCQACFSDLAGSRFTITLMVEVKS